MAPVEYAVAVDEYLGQAALGEASRRVYRISLTGWAWPLVGKPVPGGGAAGRGAAGRAAGAARRPGYRRAAARRARGAGGAADARTVNRELSALRSAVGWWLEAGWVSTDPTAGLRHRPPDGLAAPLGAAQVETLLRLPVSLREHAFWRLLHDSGAGAAELLALDAGHLDLQRHRTRARAGRAARGRHRLAGGDQPGPVLAAGRADLGTGVRDRAAGPRQGRRPLPGDRAGPHVLPARSGAIHRADQAARPGGPRLDPAPAQRRQDQ